MVARVNLRLWARCLILVILTVPLWSSSPRSTASSLLETGATFNVTWMTAGCVSPPAEAVTALKAATALWGTWISSTVPIAVTACWTPNLNCGGDALACGGSTSYHANFPHAPLVDVQYPAALANALHGVDLDPNRAEIALRFKSDAAWSFAAPRRGAAGEDFVAVALHELAHGLGFTGNLYEDYSVGFCGTGPLGFLYPCPTPYDWFTLGSDHIALLSYLPANPYALAAHLESDANFGGPNATAAHGGLVKLFTPPSFQWGSSLSHLDSTTFQGGENRLMTPSDSGVTRHPGPVTLAMLQDLGWLRVDGVPNLVTSGPLVISLTQTASFTGTLLWPAYAGQPITYTWTAAEHAPIIHAHQSPADSALLTWETPGEKRITLAAAGGVAPVSSTRSVLVCAVAVTGPETGKTVQTYTFDAAIKPETITSPITYTWAATDQSVIEVHDGRGATDSMSFSWSAPGAKTVTVTAHLRGMVVQAAHPLTLTGLVLDQHVYVPLVLREK